jgi:hypothetical protein
MGVRCEVWVCCMGVLCEVWVRGWYHVINGIFVLEYRYIYVCIFRWRDWQWHGG